MGHDLLSANLAGYAYHLRSHPMGVLTLTKVGKFLGEMANALSDSAFLWRDALLRGLLCLAPL